MTQTDCPLTVSCKSTNSIKRGFSLPWSVVRKEILPTPARTEPADDETGATKTLSGNLNVFWVTIAEAHESTRTVRHVDV